MKPHVRLEFLIDSYILVPCQFCLNKKVGETSRCANCLLTKKDRIERTITFLRIERSEWNKRKRISYVNRLEKIKHEKKIREL